MKECDERNSRSFTFSVTLLHTKICHKTLIVISTNVDNHNKAQYNTVIWKRANCSLLSLQSFPNTVYRLESTNIFHVYIQ